MYVQLPNRALRRTRYNILTRLADFALDVSNPLCVLLISYGIHGMGS